MSKNVEKMSKKCQKNVKKMSKKCRKNVEKMSKLSLKWFAANCQQNYAKNHLKKHHLNVYIED
jgi:hypothetical protein